jgi:2-polyprenyl-6-methoxyphenol hydroxylase-like FAD-dependent oxidoreductase
MDGPHAVSFQVAGRSRGIVSPVDVIIVGAGPVGLDLANRLLLDGRTVTLLEARTSRGAYSRSIGIHAPSLELLTDTGVTDALVAAGIPITEGLAFIGSKPIGTLRLDAGPPPFRFVLAVPQNVTEDILEERLRSVSPDVLRSGVRVQSVTLAEHGVSVHTAEDETIRGRFLVGCDGMRSTVRESLGISWKGGAYPDTYAMADFRDDSDLDARAAIFLTKNGLVESFPLPDGVRRWVVRTETLGRTPSPEALALFVSERTGWELDPGTASGVMGFGVNRLLAGSMTKGRALLAGDAAHVVSPIGGQGMNIGWMDSHQAARVLATALSQPSGYEGVFAAYSTRQRQIATRAARRAEFNMAFGRPGPWAPFAQTAARLLLKPPFRKFFARQFTMRGL